MGKDKQNKSTAAVLTYFQYPNRNIARSLLKLNHISIFCFVNKHLEFIEMKTHLSITRIRNWQWKQEMWENTKQTCITSDML